MRNVWWILLREAGAYWRAPASYILFGVVLAVHGLLFNAFIFGRAAPHASEQLVQFFYLTRGTTMFAAVLLSMRLIAEERQNGTLLLLAASTVRDWQWVLGKYCAAVLFLVLLCASTVYMPMVLLWHSKIAWGAIAAGYIGLGMLGAATLALGLLCSAVAPTQLLAAVLTTALVGALVLLRYLAELVSAPWDSVVHYLALHDEHMRGFAYGIINSRDVVYYASLSAFALMCATRVLELRRWR